MAADDTTEEEGESSGGSKKLIIIIVAVVVVILIGVGAFLALGASKEESHGEDEEEFEEYEEAAEGEEDIPAAILPLETFIVNLQVKGSFLKTTIQLEFAEPELPPTIENDIPKIRDGIIRILSSKTSADILTVDGKDRLREEVRDGVNETLGAEDVTQVFFTEFIIQ